MKILDLKVIVDLEHQHLSNGVNPLEDGKVPTSIKNTPNLPDESRYIGVGLGEDTNRAVFPARPHQLVHFIGRTEERLGLRDQGHDLGDAPRLFEVHQRYRQFLETSGDVESEGTCFDRPHATNDFLKGVLKRKGRIDVLHAVEQGKTTSPAGHFFELLDDQHLSLEVAQGVFEIALKGLVFVALRVSGHDFLACHVFTRRNFAQNFLFHRPHPGFGFQTEQHRNVPFCGVANTVVKQPTHDDIRVELNIRPIVECELVDSVEEFLLFLEQHVFIERREPVIVLLERFIEHHVLNPAVFNDLLFATRKAVLIDFQDVFGIIGLNEEPDRNDVAALKFMEGSFDKCLRERKTFHHLVRGLRTLRAQHLDDFHAQGLLRITKRALFPRRRFRTLKGGRRGVRQPGRMEFKQVFDLLATGHR